MSLADPVHQPEHIAVLNSITNDQLVADAQPDSDTKVQAISKENIVPESQLTVDLKDAGTPVLASDDTTENMAAKVLEPALVKENGHAVNDDDVVAEAQITPEEDVVAPSAAPVESDASPAAVETLNHTTDNVDVIKPISRDVISLEQPVSPVSADLVKDVIASSNLDDVPTSPRALEGLEPNIDATAESTIPDAPKAAHESKVAISPPVSSDFGGSLISEPTPADVPVEVAAPTLAAEEETSDFVSLPLVEATTPETAQETSPDNEAAVEKVAIETSAEDLGEITMGIEPPPGVSGPSTVEVKEPFVEEEMIGVDDRAYVGTELSTSEDSKATTASTKDEGELVPVEVEGAPVAGGGVVEEKDEAVAEVAPAVVEPLPAVNGEASETPAEPKEQETAPEAVTELVEPAVGWTVPVEEVDEAQEVVASVPVVGGIVVPAPLVEEGITHVAESEPIPTVVEARPSEEVEHDVEVEPAETTPLTDDAVAAVPPIEVEVPEELSADEAVVHPVEPVVIEESVSEVEAPVIPVGEPVPVEAPAPVAPLVASVPDVALELSEPQKDIEQGVDAIDSGATIPEKVEELIVVSPDPVESVGKAGIEETQAHPEAIEPAHVQSEDAVDDTVTEQGGVDSGEVPIAVAESPEVVIAGAEEIEETGALPEPPAKQVVEVTSQQKFDATVPIHGSEALAPTEAPKESPVEEAEPVQQVSVEIPAVLGVETKDVISHEPDGAEETGVEPAKAAEDTPLDVWEPIPEVQPTAEAEPVLEEPTITAGVAQSKVVESEIVVPVEAANEESAQSGAPHDITEARPGTVTEESDVVPEPSDTSDVTTVNTAVVESTEEEAEVETETIVGVEGDHVEDETHNEDVLPKEPRAPTPLLVAAGSDIDRPKSPWTSSFQVTTIGRGVSPEPPANEVAEEVKAEDATLAITNEAVGAESLVFNVNDTGTPHVNDVHEDVPKVESTPCAPSLDTPLEIPPRPWTPSYSVHLQGSPLHSPVALAAEDEVAEPTQLVELEVEVPKEHANNDELPPMEFARNSEEPAISSALANADDSNPQTTVPDVQSAPLTDAPAVVAELSELRNAIVLTEQSLPEVPLTQPTPEVYVTPETLADHVEDHPVEVEFSHRDIHRDIPPVLEVSLPQPPQVIVEDDDGGISTPLAEEEPEFVVPAAAATEAEPASQSPKSSTWVPSYSVSTQGSPSPTHSELPTPATEEVHAEPEPTWVRSYSVSTQGSPSPTHSELPPPAAEEAHAEPEPTWIPSYSVSTQGSPSPTHSELPTPAIEEVHAEPEPTWVPSYSVSTQGSPSPPRSELPTPATDEAHAEPEPSLAEPAGTTQSDAAAPEAASIAVPSLVVEDSEPPANAEPVLSVQDEEPEQTATVDPPNLTIVPSPLTVLMNEATKAPVEEVRPPSRSVTPVEERSSRPWTPSYAVTNQGSSIEGGGSDVFEPLPDLVAGAPPPSAGVTAVASQLKHLSSPSDGISEPFTPEGDSPAIVKDELPHITQVEVVNEIPTFPSNEETIPLSVNTHLEQPPKSIITQLHPVDENGVDDISPSIDTTVDTPTVFPRTRLDSTTSSRFFPGGWFSTPSKVLHEGRTSMEIAKGEFSKPTSPVNDQHATTSMPGGLVSPIEESESSSGKKSRWCVVM